MNNKWIVTVKNICIIIIAGIIFAGGMSNYAEAKKADIKRTKINIPMSYHAFYMQTDNDNNIVLYNYEDDGYNAQTDENYFHIYTYKYDKNLSPADTAEPLECHDNEINNVVNLDSGRVLVCSRNDKESVYKFTVYENGKPVSVVSEKIKNKNYKVGDIRVKGDKMYYVCGYVNKKNANLFLKCININNGKQVKKVKLNEIKDCYIVQMHKQRIYAIDENYTTITAYSFGGKKVAAYKLPKLKKIISIGDNGYTRRELVRFKDNYIYYSNGKDGIYRCNIKGNKRKFSKLFDLKKDVLFNSRSKLMYDYCVKDKNTFYVRFMEEEPVICADDGNPSLLVKYKVN